MGRGFLRGTHSFWVAKQVDEMMWIYHHTDRTVWRQPLPLDDEQKQKVIDKLESDILEENKYYAYDHFEDNCTTRVRNILDDATDGALKSTREGAHRRQDVPRARTPRLLTACAVPLLITDLAMGRSTDRVPDATGSACSCRSTCARPCSASGRSTRSRSNTRRECVSSTVSGCAERGAPFQDSGERPAVVRADHAAPHRARVGDPAVGPLPAAVPAWRSP